MKSTKLFQHSTSMFRTKYTGTRQVSEDHHSGIKVYTMDIQPEHEFHLKKNRHYVVVDRTKGSIVFDSSHEGECFQWMNAVKKGHRKEYTVLTCCKDVDSCKGVESDEHA